MTRSRRPTFSTRFRLNLFIERQGSCISCQSRIQAGKSWDIDHVLPLALGGLNAPQNLQLLCKPCQSAPHRRARTLRQTHSGKSINAMEKENERDNR